MDMPALRHKTTNDPPAWRNLANFFAVAMLLVVFALVADERIAEQIRALFPAGSFQWRVLKASKWLTGPLALNLMVTVLLMSPNRFKLIAGFVPPFLCTIALTHVIKWIVGRARPDLDVGPLMFMPFGDATIGFDSFPSGHTAMAMSIAFLAGFVFSRIRGLFMFIAACTAFARIAQARHFPSDVITATIIAYWVADWFRWRLGPTAYQWSDSDSHEKRPRPAKDQPFDPASNSSPQLA